MRKILLSFIALAALLGLGTATANAVPAMANATPAQPGYETSGLVHLAQYHRYNRHHRYYRHHRHY